MSDDALDPREERPPPRATHISQVRLTEAQWRGLEAVCEARGAAKSAVIRHAVSELLATYVDEHGRTLLERAELDVDSDENVLQQLSWHARAEQDA